MNYPDQAAGQAYTNTGGYNANAKAFAPPSLARGPSLEDRLDYLQHAVERLCKIRAGLEQIADRIVLTPEQANPTGGIAPAPSDLTSRFGETINNTHNQIDALERLAERIYSGLFSSNAQVQTARG